MGHTAEDSLAGRRLVWTGPVQRDHVTTAYRAAVAAGARRAPTPAERAQLAPGDHGAIRAAPDHTNTSPPTAAGASRWYRVEFDGPGGGPGIELELLLPGEGRAVDLLPPGTHYASPPSTQASASTQARTEHRGPAVSGWSRSLTRFRHTHRGDR